MAAGWTTLAARAAELVYALLCCHKRQRSGQGFVDTAWALLVKMVVHEPHLLKHAVRLLLY